LKPTTRNYFSIPTEIDLEDTGSDEQLKLERVKTVDFSNKLSIVANERNITSPQHTENSPDAPQPDGLYISGTSKLVLEINSARKIPSKERRLLIRLPE
jgi:hypothetical protein